MSEKAAINPLERQKVLGQGIVIMGVSGTGKSSVGAELAQRLKAKFIDGDDLHPRQNIIKMTQGIALNDEDRAPWLERVRDAIFSLEQKGEQGIVVCSALKKKYREAIREGNRNILFVFLHGDFDVVLARVQARHNHYMPVELLKSQFNTLETPDISESDVISVQIDTNFTEVIERCVTACTQ